MYLRREKKPNISKVIGVFLQKPPLPEKNGGYKFHQKADVVKGIPLR
jgi:hypothetical protein